MNIEKIRAAADYYSGKLSEISRQLSFAGIAVIWIFRVGTETGGISYSGDLIYPIGFFVLALLLDLLHYLYSTIVWTCLGNKMDKKNQNELKFSDLINYPANFLFASKVASVIIGYAFILKNILCQF